MIRGIRYVKRLFKSGNVCVTGLRGTGKDLIFGNVIHSRKDEPYVSNLDYGGEYHEFNYKDIDLGGNTYDSMLSAPLYYEYPFAPGTDVYISDVGCYFPAQYCNELNKKYSSIPYYLALCRQVSHNNVHINVQNLNRAWDKIREQSDLYLRCVRCFYLFGLVIQEVIVYDQYEACVHRVKPCRIKMPLISLNQGDLLQRQMYIDNFENSHGSVKRVWLIYINRSEHDTYYFEKLLKEGKKKDENKK